MALTQKSAYEAAGIRSARDSKRKSAAAAGAGAAARKAIRSSARDSKKARQQPRLLRLHIVRGSTTVAGNGDGDCRTTMDEAVWSKMPEDIVLWEVVRCVPAAKQFQLQSVSRKWRLVLTSAEFRNRAVMMAAAKKLESSSEQEQQQARVVAHVTPGTPDAPLAIGARRDYRSGSRRSNSERDFEVTVMDIDLALFVPSWFWSPNPYVVVAAAGGLVCISNNSVPRIDTSSEAAAFANNLNRYCVVNPLTRTCTVLPPVPFRPHRWLPSVTRSGGAALTICKSGAPESRTHTVATYDLAATTSGGGGGDWAVATRSTPAHLICHAEAVCGDTGTRYGCDSPAYLSRRSGEMEAGQVYVLAPGEEVACMDAPRVADLLRPDDRDLCEYGLDVVWHRGALFFVARLMCWDGDGGESRMRSPRCTSAVACAVWRLQLGGGESGSGGGDHKKEKEILKKKRKKKEKEKKKEKWVAVARLEVGEVRRLAASRYARRGGLLGYTLDFDCNDADLFRAYGVGETLCCTLVGVCCTQVDGSHRRLLVFLGFDLDTGHLELMHEMEPEQPNDIGSLWPLMAAPVELRPDLFLS